MKSKVLEKAIMLSTVLPKYPATTSWPEVTHKELENHHTLVQLHPAEKELTVIKVKK